MIKPLTLTLIFLIALPPAIICDDIAVQPRKVFDDKVEMLVPEGFFYMGDEWKDIKYPDTANQPKHVLTDSSYEINIAYSPTESKADQSRIDRYVEYLVKVYKVQRPDITFLDHGVKEINGRKVGYLEFKSEALDTDMYNLTMFTDIDQKLAFINFNCTAELQEKWASKAHEIMGSLKVL